MCMHCYSKETDGGPASYLHSAGARRHNVALGGSETYCRVRGDESLRPNLFPWPFVKLPWHMEVHSNIMMALSISVLVACVSLRAWVCVCVCAREKKMHLKPAYAPCIQVCVCVCLKGRVKCVFAQVQHVPRLPGGSSFSSLIYKYNPSLPPTVRAENWFPWCTCWAAALLS